MKTVQDSIQVDAAIGECTLNRLFQIFGGIAFMEHQDTHQFPDAFSIWPTLFQHTYHLVVSRRPVGSPPLQWLSKIEGSWLFFQQSQIMKRIKHILLTLITADMAGQLLRSIKNVDGKRIGFYRHGSACVFDWH